MSQPGIENETFGVERDPCIARGYAPMAHFMFATGIECICPTVEWRGYTLRQDELAKTRHYELVGFTWYSLQDQVDWDTGLRENNGRVNPPGLCDLDRNIRPVGFAYKQLIHKWRETLPTESTVLRIN